MKMRCGESCRHADPAGPWPHHIKLQEDRGEIHTDDCIRFCLTRIPIDDNFKQCTAGQPGSKCRVPKEGK